MATTSQQVERYFVLSENVTESSVKSIIEGIHKANEYDDLQEESLKTYERQPIELVVNTYGGSVYDGFALMSAILHSQTPVHTFCLGKAMSMGSLILICGHKRFMSPLGTVMIHQIGGGMYGTLEGIKQDVAEFERLEKLGDAYILALTNILQEQLDNVYSKKKDWYVGADDALKLGIVDELMWELAK